MEESELRNTAPEYDPKPCPLCGRTMRRGLIQSGGVLYFTDCEIVLFYYGKKWDDRRWNR